MKPKFYINEGKRCGQTSIKSIVGIERISLSALDQITGREKNQITTPIQIAYGLYKLNKNFYYPVKSTFFNLPFRELKEKTLKEFGEEIYNQTNFNFIKNIREKIKEKNLASLIKNLGLGEIEREIQKGKIAICLINYDAFVRRENKKRGHYLIIRNIIGEKVIVMDSGPSNASAKKEISKNKLKECLMETPLDYGIIFI